jgi:hypothetical protein
MMNCHVQGLTLHEIIYVIAETRNYRQSGIAGSLNLDL